MELEQLEISDFVSQCSPINKLDDEIVDKIVPYFEVSHWHSDTEILTPGGKNNFLYLIRKGAVEVFDQEDNLYSHLETGDWFGYRSILHNGDIAMKARASEDSLLYHCRQMFFYRCLPNMKSSDSFFRI